MTKTKDIDSQEGRVRKIIATLGHGDLAAGVEATAQLLGKSPNTLRQYMDPDRHLSVSLADAVRLDAAYVRATGLEPPLVSWAAARIAAETNGQTSVAAEMWTALAAVTQALGRVPEAMFAATHPASPGGAAILPHEAADIRAALDKLKDAAQILSQAVAGRQA